MRTNSRPQSSLADSATLTLPVFPAVNCWAILVAPPGTAPRFPTVVRRPSSVAFLLGRLATVVLAVALAGGPRWARAQPAGTGGSQFELADTVQLDRADATVLAQLERVKACLADRQWDEAVETLRQVMENSEASCWA